VGEKRTFTAEPEAREADPLRGRTPGQNLLLCPVERLVQLGAFGLGHVREWMDLVQMREGSARVTQVLQIAPGRLLLARRKFIHKIVKVFVGRRGPC
jgi:hypothetical protein